MKVFVINNKIKECGVHQYGKRVGNILTKSKNHQILYLEIDNQTDFFHYVDKESPDIIVYNYLGCILPWCSMDVIGNIRSRGIKQGTIIHNSPQDFFDFYLQQDPNYTENGNNYKLLRPLFDFQPEPLPSDLSTIRIGSFGFGLNCKNYPLLCKTIKDHLKDFDKKVELHFHLTVGAFANNDLSFIDSIRAQCNQELIGSNIELILTTDFISDDDLLLFLSKNNVNIFYYEKYNFYNGISSSVDYALSVKRPIAICKSNMFSHIWNSSPSICLEDINLLNIIANSTTPLETYYQIWSRDSFIENFERILDRLK